MSEMTVEREPIWTEPTGGKRNPWVVWSVCLLVWVGGLFLLDRLVRPHDATSNVALMAFVVGVVASTVIVRPLRHSPYLVRNVDARPNLDTFLVCAIASWMGVRLLLGASGNPQVGGGGLHIAHMLWGGALMVAGIVIGFVYLGRYGQRFVAGIAGLGFGLFVDELGKFITTNNNYFYKPATPILYAIFVVLYLVFQILERQRQATAREDLVNGVEWVKEAVIRHGDQHALQRACEALARARTYDPLAYALSNVLEELEGRPPPTPGRMDRFGAWSKALWLRFIRNKWFQRTAIAFFFVNIFLLIDNDVSIVFSLTGHGRHLYMAGTHERLYFSNAPGLVVSVITAAISDALLVTGAVVVFRSRLAALQLWRFAIFIAVFIEGVIWFYYDQYGAATSALAFVVILLMLNGLLKEERRREALRAQTTDEVVETRAEHPVPVP